MGDKMSDKNLNPYSNQYEFIKDYFELFDLLAKKVKIQKELYESCRHDMKDKKQDAFESGGLIIKNNVLKKDKINKSGECMEDLEVIKNKIIEKENEIKTKEKLTKENKILFPINRIRKKYKLDDIEMKILLVLLKSEVNSSNFPYRGRDRFNTPNDILNLLFEDNVLAMESRRHFYENSKLCKNELIIGDRWRNTLGDTNFYIPEKIIREIFNHKKKQDKSKESKYANVIKPKISLNQVILKENIKQDIIRCLSQVKNQSTIFKHWGFSKVINYGKGITILFVGPPGTGKTLTAEAIAKYLSKKLYVVDISQIINLYVGETEKNIVKVFREAKERNAVLFFDEADSMFYGRLKSTQRAVDVSYNQAVNVILQEIERFDGVVILATNKSLGMDEALERRISLKVEFEIPDIELREKIWKSHIPDKAPLSPDVDFKLLAKDFQFAGGHIKNAVLNAARYAASRGNNSQITMYDLIDAAMREQEGSKFFKDNRKMGFREIRN